MRKIQILGVFVAVLAFSALAVAGASATLWLKNGKSLEKAEPVTTSGLLMLHNEKIPLIVGGGQVLIHCDGLFKGTVGPGAQDLIELATNLSSGEADKISCLVLESTNTFCKANDLAVVSPTHLDWKTELILVEGVTYDDLKTEAEGQTKFGYTVTCKELNNTCELELDRSQFSANEAAGAVFEFKGDLKATCTFGEGRTLGLGTVLGYTVS